LTSQQLKPIASTRKQGKAMPPAPNPSDVTALRGLIHTFINERKQAKLDKLKPEQIDERAEIETAYRPDTWLPDAARRVTQIQLASHTVKPIHPDARGSNIYVASYYDHPTEIVGSHCLNHDDRADDVVGNAAALDVYKLLKIKHDDQTTLARVLAEDASLKAALSDQPDIAEHWMKAFTTIAESKNNPASHTLAKQVYFPLLDGGYHLLAPLFPTSLVHHVHGQMREDRFGEEAKAARTARFNDLYSPVGYREYPHLVIQKFGGTKPQNISQLNSERYGENWLLPSIPPEWTSNQAILPTLVKTVFGKWLLRRKNIYELTTSLRKFLSKQKDYTNKNIRDTRKALVSLIVDEVLLYSFELLDQPAGWSATTDCQLNPVECLWLDPYRRFDDEEFMKAYTWDDWPDEVAKNFALWLNHEISSKEKIMDSNAQLQWQADLKTELNLLRRELKA
jgi:CRISPR-associated protein Csy1